MKSLLAKSKAQASAVFSAEGKVSRYPPILFSPFPFLRFPRPISLFCPPLSPPFSGWRRRRRLSYARAMRQKNRLGLWGVESSLGRLKIVPDYYFYSSRPGRFGAVNLGVFEQVLHKQY